MLNHNGAKRTAQQQAQRMTSQQQQQLLRQQQQQQLMQQQIKQARENPDSVHFATTTQEILRKYARHPPSLTFHIYETHYRFNNTPDSNIIPKNSLMIKDFLKHVMREEIPVEMTELVKDFAIRAYDGCLILQVYDHRNLVSADKENKENQASTADKNTQDNVPVVQKPKTYRTLLRPTQLSLYYDLLYHTDSALTKFTDPLALQMESEIVNLTNRKLDLLVPLNPYQCEEYLRPEHEYPKKVWDEDKQDYKMIHSHRQEVEKQPRKLYQEELVMHKSTGFEELMFLLSSKYKKAADQVGEKKLVVVGGSTSLSNSTPAPNSKSEEGTPSTDKKEAIKASKINTAAAAAAVSGGSSATSNQFMRLRFIEEIRKRKEAQKAQQEAAVVQQVQNNGINTIGQTSVDPSLADKKPMNGMAAQAKPMVQNARVQQGLLQQQQLAKAQQAQVLRNQQLQAQKARQLQQLQQQQQQQQFQNKRAKLNQQNNMQYLSPQMGNGSQPPSNVGTPVMSNGTPRMGNPIPQQNINPQPPAQASPNPAAPQQLPQLQPGLAGAQGTGQTLQQQQQQQIFQSTLTPQEQHTFRQLQARMNALAIMGNSGVAPNRAQLTPQQQQQAIQQAKLIQQQLLQRFPAYFQRLRQFQVLQQQRRQAAATQLRQQQQGNPAVAAAQAAVNGQGQYNNVGGQGMMNQNMMNSPKRGYKRKP